MKIVRRVLILATLGAISIALAEEPPKRAIACKTPAIAGSCYWIRGRLREGNGNPSYRLWKIGTHHILGIYSGPSVDRWSLDSEAPEFPPNVQRVYNVKQYVSVYGDFEVCPLEEEKPGEMQAACIENAKNVVVKNDY
jgi:hypothetical protein